MVVADFVVVAVDVSFEELVKEIETTLTTKMAMTIKPAVMQVDHRKNNNNNNNNTNENNKNNKKKFNI